jgi:hypothetical protein
MTLHDYLREEVVYGGEKMPRYKMIEHLERTAATYTDDPHKQRTLVNTYLRGFDFGTYRG